ncbi:dephospho-CoA kinase [Rhizobium sp. LjRoot254]|uniref:dephospho-CoA kinase n=1 Tax=Rhizobium sp. LjRoot254 TaxID=3342297 RepID=UPI003ECFBD0B
MIRLGLTGSIGMGKSTTAQMFRDEGLTVIDSDAVVHELYRGEAVPLIGGAFPGTTDDDQVDRKKLSAWLAAHPEDFKLLEAIVHPLVRRKEVETIAEARESGADIIVLDIPLLFESGTESRVDKVVVVTCDADIQRARVLARPGMTEEKFAMILSRQMPDVEKRKRADFLIDTGRGFDHARAEVRKIVDELRAKGN